MNEDFLRNYVDFISKRLPSILAISFLCSLVPIVGLIPGVVLYRFQLVAPFRQYTPRGQAMLLRWALRCANFLLIWLQWIPLLGSLSVPAMALISFSSYRGIYRRSLQSATEQVVSRCPATTVSVSQHSTWYLKRNGVVSGPLAKEAIIQLASTSSFQPLDLVWSPETESWTPAAAIRPVAPTQSGGSN